MAIDDVLESIDKVTIEIKKKYPKDMARVLIANSKTLASYEVEEKDVMRWHVMLLDNLRKHL